MKELPKYECEYCHKTYSREVNFLNHRCTPKLRAEEMNTIEGKRAYMLYQKWMRSYNRLVPRLSTFMTSRFYNAFIKFSKFVQLDTIPDVDMFIQLMREKDISPNIWLEPKVLAIYFQYYDKNASPLKQAEITVNTLFDLASKYDIKVSDIFSKIQPSEIIQLMHERKLSPWILLNSEKFMKFFTRRMTDDERIAVSTLIRADTWKEKFDKNPKLVKRMRLYVSELNL